MTPTNPPPTSFDAYAEDYDASLQKGLAVSGEDREHFAEGRIRWLARRLRERDFSPRNALDYGCGVGSATPYFFDVLGVQSLLGLDVSPRSVAVAARERGSSRATFRLCQEFRPGGDMDLVFCNGVFHHIPPPERPTAMHQIVEALRPGGVFALWENNPWNPGTRYVMSRIPFDRDAILVWPGQARRLFREAGLLELRTDFLFIFPRFLRLLRFTEPFLSRFPLGAQYQVLGVKPG